VHIHGGERSGTIDEPVRHAISKLSHYHFTATDEARQRLIKMGEKPEHIFTVGAPGLDGLEEESSFSYEELCSEVGFSTRIPTVLLVFHPVVQDAAQAGEQMDEVLAAIEPLGLQVVCWLPNADVGGDFIRQSIDKFQTKGEVLFKAFSHLPRRKFVSWMKYAAVMVGNSSSGIIEAATFDTPVVNVGSRQHGRERSGNVIDVVAKQDAIKSALLAALQRGKADVDNIYGQGASGQHMLELLKSLPLDKALLDKMNAY